MKYLSLLLLLLCFAVGCKDPSAPKKESSATVAVVSPSAKDLGFPVYNFEGLQPLLHKQDDKTYIVNFWATWCKPCIAELPAFEKTFAEQKANGVELILVSLDMPSQWEKRLVPYVKENALKGKVVILDDPKMNDWIPKVSEDWQGGIPATLIYNKEKRIFIGQGLTYEELNSRLKTFL